MRLGRGGSSWWADAASLAQSDSGSDPTRPRQADFWDDEIGAMSVGLLGDALPPPGKQAAHDPAEPRYIVSEEPLDPAAAPAAPSELPHPRTAVFGRTYAEGPRPTVRMARYLELNGTLRPGDHEERFFILPRTRHRPRSVLGEKQRTASDFLRDLQGALGSRASRARSH